MLVCMISGALSPGWIFFAPVVGFLTGLMFAVLSLFITTLVDNINNFNFYFSGFLSPMFFFSGVVFPLSNLPAWLRPVAEVMPLTHCVRLVRGIANGLGWVNAWDLAYIVLFSVGMGYWAIRRISRKLID